MWISVKNSLPAPHVFVLVFFRIGGRIEKGFCESFGAESAMWDYCDNGGGLRSDATHWMPLPDAPTTNRPALPRKEDENAH